MLCKLVCASWSYYGWRNANLSLNLNMLLVVTYRYRVKDDVVSIYSHSTFTHQTYQIVVRAFTRANPIHKCFVSRDTAGLFNSSHYCPRQTTTRVRMQLSGLLPKILQIKRAQRRFTKHLPGPIYIIYKGMLERLGLESIEM